MTTKEKQLKRYNRSWFKPISFQHCLIPFSNIHVRYYGGDDLYYDYTDIYVFGIRIARIHDNK